MKDKIGNLISVTFFPVWMLITILGSAYMITIGIAETYVVTLFFGVSCFLILFLERQFPFNKEWNKSQQDVKTDLAHFVFSAGVTVTVLRAIIYVPLFLIASYLSTVFSFDLWPSEWPLIVQFTIAVVIVDFFTYWVHRFMHEVDFLWRIHSVHHSPNRLYSFNSVRVHPIETSLFYFCQTGTLVLLGAPVELLALFTSFIGVSSLLQHCNVNINYGILNWLVSTSVLHRWHHSTVVKEALNYGDNLIIWDLVFKTYYLPDTNGPKKLGPDEAITNYPKGYLDQLIVPFRWTKYIGK
ncbi:sterol desaturase family protein [Agarilytica rhodophyticola]|uniref:sterol desaturase family protein n=1 Tax=Agarilytica rhodophyticola TaxID=1737490 RepID=UPI000B344E8A|nr:sterol desaturase family protein [Agarilytica rhodophyticola]